MYPSLPNRVACGVLTMRLRSVTWPSRKGAKRCWKLMASSWPEHTRNHGSWREGRLGASIPRSRMPDRGRREPNDHRGLVHEALSARELRRIPAGPRARVRLLAVAGRDVFRANPDKVLFPEAGITKLGVERYYLAVAVGGRLQRARPLRRRCPS